MWVLPSLVLPEIGGMNHHIFCLAAESLYLTLVGIEHDIMVGFPIEPPFIVYFPILSIIFQDIKALSCLPPTLT